MGLGAEGSVGLATPELVERLRDLAFGNADTKLRFAFTLHDENGDGVIDRGALERLTTSRSRRTGWSWETGSPASTHCPSE